MGSVAKLAKSRIGLRIQMDARLWAKHKKMANAKIVKAKKDNESYEHTPRTISRPIADSFTGA